MGKIDAKGNLHDTAGRFAQKQRSVPASTLDAAAPATAWAQLSDDRAMVVLVGDGGERIDVAAFLRGEIVETAGTGSIIGWSAWLIDAANFGDYLEARQAAATRVLESRGLAPVGGWQEGRVRVRPA